MKAHMLVALVLFGLVAAAAALGGMTDDHGCYSSAGYQWCEREERCVRSWELAAERGFEGTAEAFEAFCSSPRPVIGGSTDEHGCLTSAGYQWCERENSCVHSWELATERGFEGTAEAFEAFCSSPRPVIGGTTDEHGCLGPAGYQWCEREERCVRSWELATERGFEGTAEAFEAFCSSPRPVIGGSTDEHGCLTSAGYQWCERENSCVHSWELATERGFEGTAEAFEAFCSSPRPVIGGSKDEHGCLTSAGYQWCAAESRCVRLWEDFEQMSAEMAQAYCAAPLIGSYTDEHGCRPTAGYQWCAAESRCVRMWELANELQMAPLQVERYCAGQQRH